MGMNGKTLKVLGLALTGVSAVINIASGFVDKKQSEETIAAKAAEAAQKAVSEMLENK